MTVEGFECPIPRDLPERLLRERVCQIMWRKKRRGKASEPGVKQMRGTKEIEAPTLAGRSLCIKGLEQVSTTRKE